MQLDGKAASDMRGMGNSFSGLDNIPFVVRDSLVDFIFNIMERESEEMRSGIVSFCSNVGQLLQSVKSEWEETNSWSQWDQQQLDMCVKLINKYKQTNESKTTPK